MKTKPMRLWAVVIGEKGNRFVAYQMDHHLAVFEKRPQAWRERKRIMKVSLSENVHVIPFDSK